MGKLGGERRQTSRPRSIHLAVMRVIRRFSVACRLSWAWIGKTQNATVTKTNQKGNLTSRFARLAKRCDRERPPRAQAAPFQAHRMDARNLFAISLDVNGTRKFQVPALASRRGLRKSLKDSSVQNWTIAKSRGSLVGRTVLHKSSFRRAAYLFRKAKLPVETKNSAGAN